MRERITSTLFIALVFYLLVSLAFILGPRFLMQTGVSRIYKTYLIPGPFFTADRIKDSHTLFLSWKSNGQWSRPFAPAMDDFNHYHDWFNPTLLYRSRFERSLYLDPVLKPSPSVTVMKDTKEFRQLMQYLSDRYIPRHADSTCLLITRKRAHHFKITVDTLYLIAQ